MFSCFFGFFVEFWSEFSKRCFRHVYCAHSSCPFILANMAEEEVAKLVVGNDSGMCKTSSPSDDAVDKSSTPSISAEMDHKDSCQD